MTRAECSGWAFFIRRHVLGDYRVEIGPGIDPGKAYGSLVHVPNTRRGVAFTSWPVDGLPDITDIRRQLDSEPTRETTS